MVEIPVKLTEFSELIDSYTADFVGRDWLVKELDLQSAVPGCRFVILTGSAGVGKSAFMAHLAATHPQWPRYFIRRDSRELLRPSDGKTFFLTIGGQLATLEPELFKPEKLEIIVRQRIGDLETSGEAVGARIDELKASPFYSVSILAEQEIRRAAGRATAVEIGRLVTEPRLLTLEDLQYLGLLHPAWLLYKTDPKARIVVLVDALDELRFSPSELDILEALSQLPEIPPNLRFILTSRREKFLDRLLRRSDVRELRLNILGDDNRKDLRTYAVANLPVKRVERALDQENKTVDGFITNLLDKATGNFLYLRSVLNAIREALSDPQQRERLRDLLRVEDLPDNLDRLYDYFLDSIVNWIKRSGFGDAAWRQYLRPLLGVLAVARQPLNKIQLQAFTGLDSEELSDLLRELRQFIEPTDGQTAYHIFHISFAEYLLDARSNMDYQIDGLKWHYRIADTYWEAFHTNWLQLEDLYALNFLAFHLSQSSQFDRLAALINPVWMRRRYETGNYLYDGFVSDLEMAWQSANQEVQRQIKEGVPLNALVLCIRYALIHTSINSLSENYVPELIARAAQTGLWSFERSLSLATRVPDSQQRANTYLAILRTGRLSVAQTNQASHQGLAAALKIYDVNQRVKALTALIPHLADEEKLPALQQGLGGALEDALEDALKIEDDDWRIGPLAALAPYLTGELLQQALDAVLKIEHEEHRVRVLRALLPHLTGELLQQALAAAFKIAYEGWRAEILTALIPYLVGEEKAQALQQGLDAASKIRYSFESARALTDLAPYLNGEQTHQALDAALNIDDAQWRAKALRALIPHLLGEEKVQALQQGLDAASKIDQEWSRAEALSDLAPYLTGELLQQARDAASKIEHEQMRVKALTALLPDRPGQDKARPLEADWLDGALKIHAVEGRAEALVALAPHLSPERLQQTLDAALKNAAFPDAEALAALAPYLTGELLQQALDDALQIDYEDWRVLALAPLAPYLTAELSQQALDAALKIRDWRGRTEVLNALVPNLTGEQLQQTLDAALKIDDQEWIAEALTALIPYLAGEEKAQALHYGLEAALKIPREDWRAEILTALAPHLVGKAKAEALQEALDAALNINDYERRAKALAALAPYLTGELLQKGLDAVLEINRVDLSRPEALTAFLPYIGGEERSRVLRHMLMTALKKNIDTFRSQALTPFVPYLVSEERVQALQQAMDAAAKIQYAPSRVEAITALLPFLDGEEKTRALQQALHVTLKLGDEVSRTRALTALVPHLVGEQKAQALQQAVDDALQIQGDISRAEAFTALVPYLIGEKKAQALQYALATTLNIEDGDRRTHVLAEWQRVQALMALAPELRGELLEYGLEAALKIHDEAMLVLSLTALAPYLTEALLQKGLKAALKIRDERLCMKGLVALAPHLAGQSRAQAVQYITGIVVDSLYVKRRNSTRGSVLRFCAEAGIFTPLIIDNDSLAAIAGYIVEVCNHWKWQ